MARDKLSDEQVAILERLAATPKGIMEVFAPGPSHHGLAVRRLVYRQLIGMRWWRFGLTSAGRAALAELKQALAESAKKA